MSGDPQFGQRQFNALPNSNCRLPGDGDDGNTDHGTIAHGAGDYVNHLFINDEGRIIATAKYDNIRNPIPLDYGTAMSEKRTSRS